VTRSLSPLGADRFYALVKAGFYNNSAFFRVVPAFVIQVLCACAVCVCVCACHLMCLSMNLSMSRFYFWPATHTHTHTHTRGYASTAYYGRSPSRNQALTGMMIYSS
jgi:hypothetical protein